MRSKRENGKLFVELSHKEEELFLALLRREQRDFEERRTKREFEDPFLSSIIKETRHCISCAVSLFLGYGKTEYEIEPDTLERVSRFMDV